MDKNVMMISSEFTSHNKHIHIGDLQNEITTVSMPCHRGHYCSKILLSSGDRTELNSSGLRIALLLSGRTISSHEELCKCPIELMITRSFHNYSQLVDGRRGLVWCLLKRTPLCLPLFRCWSRLKSYLFEIDWCSVFDLPPATNGFLFFYLCRWFCYANSLIILD